MKTFLKLSLLASAFILTSCAHHHGCNSCCGSQCDMHKEACKEKCKDGSIDQCPMKKDEKKETPAVKK